MYLYNNCHPRRTTHTHQIYHEALLPRLGKIHLVIQLLQLFHLSRIDHLLQPFCSKGLSEFRIV